jgi:hypothetical protein
MESGISMKKLPWTLVRTAERLGMPGQAALALALLAVLYLALMVWPAQQRLAALETRSLRTHDPQALAAPALSPVSVFLATFPPSGTLSTQLQSLFDIAEQYQLDMGEVSYKWERRQDERLQRYHVSFALNAPYPDVRAFLADVLAALPHAALDQLSFNRDSVQDDTVQATVRLTFYLVR